MFTIMKHRHVWISILGMLLAVLLVGCADAVKDTETINSDTSDNEGEVSQEVVEAINTWEASPVLVSMQTVIGYTSYFPDSFPWSLTPDLVVYADGLVVGRNSQYIDSLTKNSYWTAKVTPNEICYLLNQIDSVGFFNFDKDEYITPGESHLNTTQIEVQSWKTRTISVRGLDFAVYNADGGFSPSSLTETYRLLKSFPPPNAMPYEPERIGLLINQVDNDNLAKLWPLSTPDLGELADGLEPREHREFAFDGERATRIFNLFQGDWFKLFKDGGKTYMVTMRPFFPLENGSDQDEWELSTFEETPEVDITCSNQVPEVAWLTDATPPAQPDNNEQIGDNAPLEFVDSIGTHDEPGQLGSIGNIGSMVSTPQGDLLVADLNNYRLQRFALDGTVLELISLPNMLTFDMDFLSNDNLILSNSRLNTIEIRTPQGVLLQSLNPNPDGSADLIAVGLDDQIYVGEKWGESIIILNADGNIQEIWNGPSDELFVSISDIATDSFGNLFIVDDYQRVIKRLVNGEVHEFAISGTYIGVRPSGAFYITNGTSVTLYDSDGQQLTQLELEWLIEDIAIAPGGEGFIINADMRKIPNTILHYYDEEGTLLTSFGRTSLLPGQFKSHSAFSVSSLGDIWVVGDVDDPLDYWASIKQLIHLDSNHSLLNIIDDFGLECQDYSLAASSNHEVFIANPCAGTVSHIDRSGKVLAQWGESGLKTGEINLILDIVLAPNEHSIYLTDYGNNRVMQFDFEGRIIAEWNNEQLNVQEPLAIAVSADGTFFLIDGATKEIVVRSADGRTIRWMLPTSNGSPYDIAIDENEQRVYVGGSDENVYVYDWNGQYLGFLRYWDGNGVMVNVGPEGNLYRSAGFQEIQIYRPTN